MLLNGQQAHESPYSDQTRPTTHLLHIERRADDLPSALDEYDTGPLGYMLLALNEYVTEF